MPDSVITQRMIQVEHVKIESTKPFAEVRAALESSVPRLDAGIFALSQRGESERAKSELERLPALSIFSSRDHGALLRIIGQSRKALQYDIGNPLTATRMTQHQLSASAYAPLRILLYENEAGHAVFEYDRPSSLFGRFGDARGRAFRSCTSVRRSSRSGCSIAFRARPLSKMASSICRMVRGAMLRSPRRTGSAHRGHSGGANRPSGQDLHASWPDRAGSGRNRRGRQ
jgi:hypothetical protein